MKMTQLSKYGRNTSIKLIKKEFQSKENDGISIQVTWLWVPLHHMTVYRR